MMRYLFGTCVLVLALECPARADDYLLDLTVWKVEVKDGAEAPTSYAAVKKAGKVVHSFAITSQANKPFEIKVFQPSADQSLDFHGNGVIIKKDTDKKPAFELEFKYLTKTLKKTETESAIDWHVKSTGDLHPTGHVLAVLQTPQGTLVMTLASKK